MQIERNCSVRPISVFGKKTVSGTLIAAILFLTGAAVEYTALPQSITYTFFRAVNKQVTYFKTRNWESVEGEYFVVRFHEGDSNIANLVLNTAEEAYKPVNEILNFSFSRKNLILIYPNKEEMGKNFSWSSDQSAMGVYWAGIIRILSPEEWIGSTNWDKLEREFKQSGPMAHEYAHLAVDYITGGNYSRWLTEGIAQYVEREVTGFAFNQNAAVSEEDLFNLGEIDGYFDVPSEQEKAYTQSLAMIDYFVERYGEEKLIDTLKSLKSGKSLDAVWQKQLGIDIHQFEKEFKKWRGESQCKNSS